MTMKRRKCTEDLTALGSGLHSSIVGLNELSDNLKSELEELRGMKHRITKDVSTLIKRIGTYHKNTAVTTRTLKTKTGTQEKLAEHLSELHNEISMEKAVCSHYKQAVYDLEKEISELETQVSELQIQKDELEDENFSLRNQIEEANLDEMRTDQENFKAVKHIFQQPSNSPDLLSSICNIKVCVKAIRECICDSGDGGAEDGFCVACKTMASTHACLPCGHLCMCNSCSTKITKCPYCRAPAKDVARIYGV